MKRITDTELRKKMWDFSKSNGWNDDYYTNRKAKYFIYFNHNEQFYTPGYEDDCIGYQTVYFTSKEIAEKALKEIFLPALPKLI